MTTIAYFNGSFLPLAEVRLSPLDRGFSFGDGVYEVIPVYHKKPFLLQEHIQRLNQSLEGIRLLPFHTPEEWTTILETLVEKNIAPDQWIYLQVTRGIEPMREHRFPKEIIPTIFAVSYPKTRLSKMEQSAGIKVTAVTDIRWKYCHIKTTARLPYVLMNQEAKENGFDEGIIMNTGFALEGTTSNIFIVRHGVIFTPPKSSQILSGITRDKVLSLAEKNKIPYRETKISERDLLKADEMWITSATRGIHPVIEFNGHPVNDGKAGPVWERMWDLYAEEINRLSLPLSS